jgi:hypothetical protein
MIRVAGFYDLVGDVVEVVEVEGRFIIRFESVPDRFAPTLKATGDHSFIVEKGTVAGAEISFHESGAVIGGIIPMERTERPDPLPWPTGKGLTLDEPSPSDDEAAAYQQLWTEVRQRSDGGWITWGLPWPRHRFVEWLTHRRHVIFHGSPRDDLDLFVPRRGSIELFDHGGRGNRNAVYGTPYGLWSMWFAVIDRSKLDGSIRNGVFNFSDGTETLDVYNFSVHHEYLDKPIWRTGTLYLLPAESFQPIPFYPGGPLSNEWASTDELRPIARLEVRPEDFPFLDRVGGHDDSELIASDKLGEIVTDHIEAGQRTEGGLAAHLRWDDEIAKVIEPYLESRRRFTPDVIRQHRIEPNGEHWIDVKGPDGFVQTYQQMLRTRGIAIEDNTAGMVSKI